MGTFDPIVVIPLAVLTRPHATPENEYTNLRIHHRYSVAAAQIMDSCKILQLAVKPNPLSYNAILPFNQYKMTEQHSHAVPQ
jgi:hypothetical protein